MIVSVAVPFCGHGFNMPAPGTLLDVHDDLANHLVSIGVCSRYETKVVALPEVKKTVEPLASVPAVPAPPAPTRKRSRKSATKR
jgi:hypothetical protein